LQASSYKSQSAQAPTEANLLKRFFSFVGASLLAIKRSQSRKPSLAGKRLQKHESIG
jgi:hypothetical protein